MNMCDGCDLLATNDLDNSSFAVFNGGDGGADDAHGPTRAHFHVQGQNNKQVMATSATRNYSVSAKIRRLPIGICLFCVRLR
jgi:hypothetical protein